MSATGWAVLAMSLAGLVAAILIVAFVWECTRMPFRRWDALP